ncbi:MAG TPA: DUF6519 domain-containing protein [Bryobacteraceae bacterium]|nr:DUF6519 domain-containing protein [Bryobacteraceae bacterium]
MPADRDRLTYDERQQYRSVVAQQGRVTVAADFNEAQEIFAEEQRKEALDIVGPCGTSDDGYRIGFPVPDPNFDLTVSAGTMYVGGMRVALLNDIRYFAQPDWIDPPAPPATPKNEYIYLFLQEQEISAVEDQSLKDRALGGPDTTQRTRLLQHIVRTPTNAANCADALAAQIKDWAAEGLVFDPDTMRLNSASTLLVGFDNTQTNPDPCDPTASGGFLGAENQLIRVRITAPGQFVWGYDNASFLYRVDVVDNQTVKLQSPPVDAFHQPRAGQAVELLRTEGTLSDGEFIAYDVGRVDVLTDPYNADSQTIRLPAALTADLIPPNGTPRLFLRVWEESKPFQPGTPVSLGTTGVNVTFNSSGGFHAGDFWAFAVRPSSPAEVYPARYTQGPQPPDGPRRWVCPLAVITWNVIAGTAGNTVQGVILADCRNVFDNLVELTKRKSGGCCTVSLSPTDKVTLAQAIDALAGHTRVIICLAPGTYTMTEPLKLNPKHSGLTIEGCHDEVALVAAKGKEDAFLHGMFILDHVDDITLQGLSFHLPLASAAGLTMAMTPDQLRTINSLDMKRLLSGIGIRAFSCGGLTVEDCQFSLQPPPPSDNDFFEAAILLGGTCDRLTIRNNRFTHSGESLELASNHYGLRFGIVMAPVSRIKPTITQSPTAPVPVLTAVEGTVLPASLPQASITNNFFSGISAAAVLYGDLGDVRIEDNTVRQCASGFWLFSSRTLAFIEAALPNRPQLRLIVDAVSGEPVILLGSVLARGYPWPGALSDSEIITVKQVPASAAAASGSMLARGAVLHNVLVIMERQAFSTGTATTRFALECAQNLLDGFSGTGAAQHSQTGLVVWGELQDLTTTAVINANHIRSTGLQGGFPTSALVFLARVTVTGNLILNEGAVPNKNSLILVPSSGDIPNIAITGNVFRGAAQLPPRPAVAAPLNVWDVFNTIVP